MDVVGRMETYRDALTAANVRCVLDARDVNPPAVLIRPPTLAYRFGRGCVGATWAAWLFLPDAGQIDALRVGVPILDAATEALAGVGAVVTQAAPADFQTADGATVPGFILSWESSN